MIDTKVLPLVHHLFDLCKAAVQIDHVMFLWIATAGNVKTAVHMFHLVFVLASLLFYLPVPTLCGTVMFNHPVFLHLLNMIPSGIISYCKALGYFSDCNLGIFFY